MTPIDWRSVHSMSEDIELEKLEAWVKEKYEKEGRELRCLEIGTFKGKTAAIMAQFGEVLAVDLWGNVDRGLLNYESIGQQHFDSFIKNMVRLKLIERVHGICSTSKVLEFILPMDFDVAFIDGAHFYEAVKLDIERAIPHLSHEGIMIFHDLMRPGYGYPPYDPNHPHHGPVDPWAGVAKAVNELLDTKRFKIKEHFLGIACLERTV